MNFLKTENILKRETIMKQKYLSNIVTKLMIIRSNLFAILDLRQNRQVFATVSWNR